jgi:hypothetical protein
MSDQDRKALGLQRELRIAVICGSSSTTNAVGSCRLKPTAR